jgi:hypothetical protein
MMIMVEVEKIIIHQYHRKYSLIKIISNTYFFLIYSKNGNIDNRKSRSTNHHNRTNIRADVNKCFLLFPVNLIFFFKRQLVGGLFILSNDLLLIRSGH